jgi:hypothetical protein
MTIKKSNIELLIVISCKKWNNTVNAIITNKFIFDIKIDIVIIVSFIIM